MTSDNKPNGEESKDLVTIKCFNERCSFEKQVQTKHLKAEIRGHNREKPGHRAMPVEEREILVETKFVQPVKASTHTQAQEKAREIIKDKIPSRINIQSTEVVDDPEIDTHRNYCSESIVENGNKGNGQTNLLEKGGKQST